MGRGVEVETRSWARVDGIDLLRGAAIFFVLMNHVNMQMLFAKVPYLMGLPLQLVYTLVWNGQLGVQMFFAVSGYLITSTSIRRWGTPGGMVAREFYWLRFARIAPLMILLLVVLSGLSLAGVKKFVVGQETGGLGRALVAALTFHVNYLEATRGYLPGSWDILWSLSVEEMFYLFFPLVARGLRKRWLLVGLLGVLIVAGPFARMKMFDPNPVWREYSYLGGMDAIAMGCLTAMLLAGRRVSRRWVWVCGSLGAALLVFCFGFSVEAYKIGLGKSGLLMTVVGGSASVGAGARDGPAELRDLFDAHVCGDWGVCVVCDVGEAAAGGVVGVCGGDYGEYGVGVGGVGGVFGEDESVAAAGQSRKFWLDS
jgi:peptidoglycan/LPS O-acetylase OafA/YrhL